MQGIEETMILTPRLSLVKQLLEYKRYKGSTLALAAKGLPSGKKGCFRIHRESPLETEDKEHELPLESSACGTFAKAFPTHETNTDECAYESNV